ncbi:glycerophosphodiester phosphodiesterase family protein [Niabella terrae]
MNRAVFLGVFFIGCCAGIFCAAQPSFAIHAHRGGRGLMPENTIAAMRDAIDRGVPVLEMDLQMTRDHQIIVAHDPTLNSNYTTTPSGDSLSRQVAKSILLYQLDYKTLLGYDVGVKFNPEFPRQQKMRATIPLLSALLDSTESYARKKGRNIRYNIEIKSSEKADGRYYPDLDTYVNLAMSVIESKKMADRVIIQSFDRRALQLLHRQYPNYALSYLISKKESLSPQEQIRKLGFQPAIYSPNVVSVTSEIVRYCHEKGMRIVPGVANELHEIKRLKDMGVDGLITDYSDAVSAL